jgi:replicative DNA helicase
MENRELITEERLDTLRANSERLAADFLDNAKDRKSFVCPNPACDHGKGEAAKTDKDGHRVKNTGDGIKFDERGAWHCFSCQSCGDIITAYQLKLGVESFPQAVADLEEKLNILPPAPKRQEREKEKMSNTECIAQFEKLAFSPMVKEYRGLSVETLNSYGVKGCREFLNPKKAGTFHGSRVAVCFPTSGGNYFVRALEHKENERCDKWDIGDKAPFNLEALKSGRPVFITEGVIDALSIIEAGGQAVGLSGTDGMGAFLEALKDNSFSNCLLLAADNDKPGGKANSAWAEALDKIGIMYKIVDTAKLYGGNKDANEALNADKEAFKARLQEAEAHKAQLENPRGRSMLALEKALQNGDLKRYPTHVEVIDDLFNGGLSKKKLIVLGGQTGSSKTAFVQWWIESQAMKNPKFTALLFNFEMDTETLMARSISRILHDNGQSVTFNEVCDGHPQAQKGIELYKQKIGSRVEYYYGIRSKEAIVKIIRENVAYNAANGLDTPFIVCDYLQIMPSKESDERLAINASMEWLQDIAKDYNTVVIAITSMNRQTNNDTNDKANPLNGASGSGRIEYDADFFLTIEGKEEKRVTMHKGRMVKPGTYKKLTFLGQYMTFVYKKDKPLEKTSYGEAVQSLLSGRELTRKETKVANDLTLKMPY